MKGENVMSKLYNDILLLTDYLLDASTHKQQIFSNLSSMEKAHAMKYLSLINGIYHNQSSKNQIEEKIIDDISLIHKVREQIKELQEEREAIQRLSLYAK